MKEEWLQLTDILDQSDNIVFFGGAGCSCESGIPILEVLMVYTAETRTKFYTGAVGISYLFMRYRTNFFHFIKRI